MEFELWLFAVKQLAQNYAMCQMIYSQLSDDEKAELRKEYEASVGGDPAPDAESSGSPAPDTRSDKTIKEYRDLLNSFHNAMSIAERFLEKNSVKYLDAHLPIDVANPDEVFLRRSFVNLGMNTLQTMQYLSHVAKPIVAEGKLAPDGNGNYVIDGHVVNEGMFLEFFYINRWEIGRLCKGEDSAYGYFFLGFRNELFDVNLDGLLVRIRG
ncbi:MAG: hypothetical protein K6A90_11900 [Lachnospiraceae bacterium]|nr:hypothetical protein [Lachnospiraceae bacterium]